MKTAMKKLLSLVLVAMLLVSAVPFCASATTTGDDGEIELASEGRTVYTLTVTYTKKDGTGVKVGSVSVEGIEGNVVKKPDIKPLIEAAEDITIEDWGAVNQGDFPVTFGTSDVMIAAEIRKYTDNSTPSDPTPDETTQPTTYTVSFYDVNSAPIKSFSVGSGSTVDISNVKEAANGANVGSGSTFAGWKVNKTGDTFNNAEVAAYTITSNISFYAVATENPTNGTNNTTNNTNNNGTTSTNKFPYAVYLNIYLDNKVDAYAKHVDISKGAALDGVVTLAEVEQVVRNYYTAKDTSKNLVVDGLYLAQGNWVKAFVEDNKVSKLTSVDEMAQKGEVTINVMVTNAKAKTTSSSSSTADPSNPKTGDAIYMTVTVLTVSAGALALVYFFNKKRAIVK